MMKETMMNYVEREESLEASTNEMNILLVLQTDRLAASDHARSHVQQYIQEIVSGPH